MEGERDIGSDGVSGPVSVVEFKIICAAIIFLCGLFGGLYPVLASKSRRKNVSLVFTYGKAFAAGTS
jgi:hypothetical protein